MSHRQPRPWPSTPLTTDSKPAHANLLNTSTLASNSRSGPVSILRNAACPAVRQWRLLLLVTNLSCAPKGSIMNQYRGISDMKNTCFVVRSGFAYNDSRFFASPSEKIPRARRTCSSQRSCSPHYQSDLCLPLENLDVAPKPQCHLPFHKILSQLAQCRRPFHDIGEVSSN